MWFLTRRYFFVRNHKRESLLAGRNFLSKILLLTDSSYYFLFAEKCSCPSSWRYPFRCPKMYWKSSANSTSMCCYNNGPNCCEKGGSYCSDSGIDQRDYCPRPNDDKKKTRCCMEKGNPSCCFSNGNFIELNRYSQSFQSVNCCFSSYSYVHEMGAMRGAWNKTMVSQRYVRWYDMRYDIIRYDTMRYAIRYTIQNDMIYGTIPYDIIRYDTICDIIRYDAKITMWHNTYRMRYDALRC